ncbi:MAG: ABC transporter permease [Bacteroidetes bacterium]|jgi:putative spermidine/putrescine transport system permease protein|nr:ABC transporter permease [Bacteroidota bacterium]
MTTAQRTGVAVMALVLLVPPVLLLYLSFSTRWYYPAVFSHPFTTEHWQWVGHAGSPLLQSLGLSLGLSGAVSAVATTAGFFASRHLAYYTRSAYWLLAAYFPYVIAPVIFAVMLNVYLLRLGLTGTVAGVMLAQLVITFPYAVLFFYGFWNERIRAMEHLVQTMGGGYAAVFRHAIWPSARGLAVVCFFQTYLISWFEYGLTQFIGVGRVPTLTVMVFRYIQEANPYLAALAGVLLVAPPLLLLLINRRFLVQRFWGHG